MIHCVERFICASDVLGSAQPDRIIRDAARAPFVRLSHHLSSFSFRFFLHFGHHKFTLDLVDRSTRKRKKSEKILSRINERPVRVSNCFGICCRMLIRFNPHHHHRHYHLFFLTVSFTFSALHLLLPLLPPLHLLHLLHLFSSFANIPNGDRRTCHHRRGCRSTVLYPSTDHRFVCTARPKAIRLFRC